MALKSTKKKTVARKTSMAAKSKTAKQAVKKAPASNKATTKIIEKSKAKKSVKNASKDLVKATKLKSKGQIKSAPKAVKTPVKKTSKVVKLNSKKQVNSKNSSTKSKSASIKKTTIAVKKVAKKANVKSPEKTQAIKKKVAEKKPIKNNITKAVTTSQAKAKKGPLIKPELKGQKKEVSKTALSQNQKQQKITIEKAETRLKPVTKPIVKNTGADSSAALKNMAIRSKYKRIEIEYPVQASTHILFSYLSTSSGLSEWFADKVIEKSDYMIFIWDDTQQAAKVLSVKEDQYIRFRWLDMPEAIFFEFRIETDDLTTDSALIITDFCEDEKSVESTRKLWDSQIEKLFNALGITH